MKIDIGRERGGLYYLENGFQYFSKGQAYVVQENSVDKKKKNRSDYDINVCDIHISSI